MTKERDQIPRHIAGESATKSAQIAVQYNLANIVVNRIVANERGARVGHQVAVLAARKTATEPT